jgi:hypothetical protein
MPTGCRSVYLHTCQFAPRAQRGVVAAYLLVISKVVPKICARTNSAMAGGGGWSRRRVKEGAECGGRVVVGSSVCEASGAGNWAGDLDRQLRAVQRGSTRRSRGTTSRFAGGLAERACCRRSVAGRARAEEESSAPTEGWRGEARVRCGGTEAITAGSGGHKHSCYGDAESEGEGRRMESRGTPAWTASASASASMAVRISRFRTQRLARSDLRRRHRRCRFAVPACRLLALAVQFLHNTTLLLVLSV